MGLRYGGKIVNQKPVSIVKRYYGGKLVDDYSAMRGPCPEGFHVPINSEWIAVKTVWTSLGGGASDGTNFGIAFKLPRAGYRSYGSGGYNNGSKGSQSRYRASTSYRDYSAKTLTYTASTIDADASSSKAIGGSIRPFKDKAVVPTSSWTKLYGTSIEAGGIFWSSTDGLISLSSNGQTWITIADKNLGATTVWNDGDTLTDDNCGGYFQRGNNYMFPFTGTVTTSSTQVDASNYGPGNYYYSDIFTTTSSNSVGWDSSNNTNIRGGDTGVQQRPAEVIKVYKGNIQIRPNMPAEFTDWDAGVISSVTAELGQDIDSTILHLFGEGFYVSLDDDIGGGESLNDLGWIYDTITSGNDEWNGLQISDGGDMTDMNHIIPYGNTATDAVCIVWDNDDWSDAEYLVGTSSGHGSFAFQLSSLATHFSGKDTVCMFIFLM